MIATRVARITMVLSFLALLVFVTCSTKLANRFLPPVIVVVLGVSEPTTVSVGYYRHTEAATAWYVSLRRADGSIYFEKVYNPYTADSYRHLIGKPVKINVRQFASSGDCRSTAGGWPAMFYTLVLIASALLR